MNVESKKPYKPTKAPLWRTISINSIVGILLLVITCVVVRYIIHDYTVIRVLDGDTLDVRGVWGGEERIRLAGVDAPESNQPYGPEAKALLQELAGDVISFTPEWATRDKYGRQIRHVRTKRGQYLNRIMLWEGAAHAYMTSDPADHNAAEQAKRQKKGLWKAENVMLPSEWRANHKGSQARPVEKAESSEY